MDLKNFVSESLTQIVDGVADAQTRIRELNVGAAVNPHVVPATTSRKIGKPSTVEFDVAVTVSDRSSKSSSTEAAAGFLSVVSARVGAKDAESDTLHNEAVSRIKFSVEIAQPADIHTY